MREKELGGYWGRALPQVGDVIGPGEARSFEEASGFGIKRGCLDELEELRWSEVKERKTRTYQVRDAASKAEEMFFGSTAAEEVGFAVAEVGDVVGEGTVEFLDGPLHVEKHLEPVIDRAGGGGRRTPTTTGRGRRGSR